MVLNLAESGALAKAWLLKASSKSLFSIMEPEWRGAPKSREEPLQLQKHSFKIIF